MTTLDATNDGLSVDDVELLTRHAPVLRLDGRELFVPTDVDRYVAACSLWDRHGLVAERVTLDELDHRWGADAHLRFVDDDDRRGMLAAEVRRTARRVLSPRLGRVGLLGRILDALFQLSALFRPTTPRATTAAAAERATTLGLHDQPVCYGRVLPAGEWLVLHYAWFYAMNDWRTSYGGLNDHEADWEQAWIYCDPADRTPIWIAVTNHEHRGDDLRRRWDDPEVTTIDGHPVLYPGAGSHALFFQPGDYISRIDVPTLRWAARLQSLLRPAQADEPGTWGFGPALGIPFIDTATGDGTSISTWDLRLMRDEEPWLGSFRGLWGRDTGDPTNAERGPAGPKFDRSGEIRASWADPLGYAGLHGTPPPSAVAARVNLDKIDQALADLDARIRERGRLFPLARQTDSVDRMAGESERLTENLRQKCELEGLRRRVQGGHQPTDGLRNHLRNPARPLPAPSTSTWVSALWAALSVPALLVLASVSFLFQPSGRLMLVPVGLVMAVAVDFVIERRFHAAIGLLASQLSILAGAMFFLGLLVAIGRYTIGMVLVIASILLIVVNTAELLAIRDYRARHQTGTAAGR